MRVRRSERTARPNKSMLAFSPWLLSHPDKASAWIGRWRPRPGSSGGLQCERPPEAEASRAGPAVLTGVTWSTPGLQVQGGDASLQGAPSAGCSHLRDGRERLRWALLAGGRLWWQENVLRVPIPRLKPPECGPTGDVEKITRSSSKRNVQKLPLSSNRTTLIMEI